MKINTRDFGETEIDESTIISIPRGIIGFEETTRRTHLFYDEVVQMAYDTGVVGGQHAVVRRIAQRGGDEVERGHGEDWA